MARRVDNAEVLTAELEEASMELTRCRNEGRIVEADEGSDTEAEMCSARGRG